MTLAQRLRARIAAEGPIAVEAFMRAALYDPEEGYYTRGARIGGSGADFYTASNVSLFPHAMRRFVDAALARIGPARVVELGGGTGALAASLGTRVTIVEPHAGMADQQRARGLEVVESLDALKPEPTLFLANEVLDALPVHRILSTPDGMREGRVTWEDGAFREVASPLPSELATHAARLAPFLPVGAWAEVCLAAGPLLDAMARAAPRSLALFLDYGGETRGLYGEARPGGTLRGYREHRVTDALDAPGSQDVTADVDFDAIADAARDRGFGVAGFVPQGQFLADLGLVDDMTSALGRGDMEAYLAAKQLVVGSGMGERFHALCLARGVPVEPPLPGFRKDSMPGASRR